MRGKYEEKEEGREGGADTLRRGYDVSPRPDTGASKIMQGARPQSIRCGNLPPCPCPPELPVATPLAEGARPQARPSQLDHPGILDFLEPPLPSGNVV